MLHSVFKANGVNFSVFYTYKPNTGAGASFQGRVNTKPFVYKNKNIGGIQTISTDKIFLPFLKKTLDIRMRHVLECI